MQPAKETWTGRERLEKTMQTSLQGIARRAAKDRRYRAKRRDADKKLRNLFA